ncbi:MAG: MYG1 family protein [Patescibacteria group bacterium]
MTTIKTTKKLVTHNGSFHADDIFACATLSILLEKKGESLEIIRTRDEEIIKSGDYVFDIGNVYDAEKNKFDHHQIGGAGKRDNGIEYASFGLVWKKFGEEICESKDVADFIDKKLAQPVDAGDNGMDLIKSISEAKPYFLQTLFKSFLPSWKNANEETLLLGFLESVNIAKGLLSREIALAQDASEAGRKVLECYEQSKDKRIIILDQKYPWEENISKYSEPIFVIFPRLNGVLWGVEGVPASSTSFERRKKFPEIWAGLRDEELQKVTGVADAVFCHRGLFMCVAKTKEGATKLAELALLK